MKELLDKLSSYNLFNYLLPGVLFASLASKLTRYSFIQSDIIVGVFVYYFIGLVISRVGSLIIEPILKKSRFVKFTEYEDFIFASQQDEKIELLSEANNMYRTLCSLFLLLVVLKGYQQVEVWVPVLANWNGITLIFMLLIMFLFAYRKQTTYITRRINKAVSSKVKENG
jgi:hypothetical protein